MVMGTGLAQLIVVASGPLLSRVYSPSAYGVYTLFTSVVSVAAPLSTGKYELATGVVESDEEAKLLTALCVLISTPVSLLILGLILTFRDAFGRTMKSAALATCLPIVPFAILFYAWFTAYSYWFNRKKDYRVIATAKVGSSLGSTACSLSLGLVGAGPLGMAFGYLMGQLVAFLMTFRRAQITWGDFLRGHGPREYVSLAKRFKKFPIYLMSGNVINALSGQVYVFLIGSLYDTATLGTISMSQAVILLPTSLVSTAIAEVFRQRASEDLRNQGSCRPLLMKTVGNLGLLSILPFGILTLFAPWLFSFVFGAQWREAGVYARVLVPFYMARFVLAPISGVVIQISQRVEVEVMWQMGLLIANVLSVYLGKHLFSNVESMLLLFSLANAALIVVAFLLAYRLSVLRSLPVPQP